MLQQMRGIAKYIWFFLFVAFVGGFLLADMSGLIGQGAVTTSTIVAKVNGDEIPYLAWENVTRSLIQQQEQQTGRSLNLDERLQVEQQAFDQLVTELLLQQEYERRGIRVTDAEIVQAARYSPPPQFQDAPELQTDGRFDPNKYERYLSSPLARQQGLLAQLESYYRAEIPRNKLFAQLFTETWLGDDRLFEAYRDERDSARVAFVALHPTPAQVQAVEVSDADARDYYRRYAGRWTAEGVGVVSLVSVNRVPNAADTAAALARLRAVRREILDGGDFAEIAKRESEDSLSAIDGGSLGRGPRGRFVATFENAAFALRVGQITDPVRTEFGYHLIQVTEKKGDTIAVRHILQRVRQQDSTATVSDRAADRLAALAAGSSDPAAFDRAAEELGLLVTQIPVAEGRSATYQGRTIGGVSGWAFSGVRVGETGDLIDDESGYYLVRLDSLTPGGERPFAAVKDDIVQALRERRAVANLIPQAEALLADAQRSTLEAAASKAGLSVDTTGVFARPSFVEGLGFSNEAIGAAFGLELGEPALVKTLEGVFVMRVDYRRTASREAFDVEKVDMRPRLIHSAREQRVRAFMDNLRREAKIDDRRREINAALRRQVVE